MNLRRLLLIASLILAFSLVPSFAPAQTLDQYGGYKELPVPGGGTGYFRVAKLNNRWVFATPLGNAFWMRSVYVVNSMDAGKAYDDAIKYKYGGSRALWASQSITRLMSWGFNAIGEYAATGSWNVLPVGTYNSPANRVKAPFIRLIRPSTYAYGAVKDIVFGTDPTVYTGWRGNFYDVYDPAWPAVVARWANDQPGARGNTQTLVG